MKKLFVCALALAAFVACDKEPNVGGGDEAGKVYMKFSVKMETTRTGTDDKPESPSDATPDIEVGYDYENTVSKVDIVLANADSYVVAKNVVPEGSGDTYIASFSSLELKASTAYDVYIYANCSAPEALSLDATSEVAVADMTQNNLFWMTNAYEANEVTMPADMSVYTSPSSPLNLGAHYVERSMARFDFMPKNDNKFELADGVTVTLTQAALINHSKAFYTFRRVSADGTNANWTVGGVETPQNYVVDVDYAAKADGYTAAQVANFDAHLTLPSTWTWKSIASADLTKADNWEGEDDGETDYDGEHSLNDYYFWQYAKENTIPGVNAQEHGISTGIVFKGQIASTNDKVTAAMAKKEMIYVFENVLYGGWADVEAAAADAKAPATLVAAVNKVKAVEAPTSADYANAGFTGYSADADGKYFTYYYYWNRHNDNGDNVTMGKMEFAVVRNNVYKLCVDKISKLGHPTPSDPTDPDPDPDPDPVDPTDPDEELNYYFNVTVKVLPWVVRVNHIEF